MDGDFWAGPRSGDVAATPNWAELASQFGGLGYWRFDVASQTLAFSDGLFRLYGLEAANPPDMDLVRARIHPDDGARASRLVQRAAEFGEDFTLQIRLKRADGSWGMLRHRSVCARTATGQVATVFGVAMDVTEAEACRVFLEHGNDVIFQTDLDGRITFVSRSLISVTGYAPEELVGRTAAQILGDDVAAALAPRIQALLEEPGQPARRVEFPVPHKDGRPMWLETRPRPLTDTITGAHIGYTDVVRDISERKTAEKRLEYANIVLKTQIDASPVAMILVDPDRGTSTFNRMYAVMWQIPPADMVEGRHQAVYERSISLVKDQEQFLARVEYLNRHPAESSIDTIEMIDGRLIERYSAGVHAPGGVHLGRVWYFRDVTEHKQALARAMHLARYDRLTGLPNRDVFVESVRNAISRTKRGEPGFAVLYLDLDHFKDVNDTLGHPVGDALLEAVAGRLRTCTRESDVVARFGGDEFAVMAEDDGGADGGGAVAAATLADRLIKAIDDPFWVRGAEIHTTASIGIDMHGPESSDAETLLSHADLALYRAKAEGRGAYRFFTPAMDTAARTRVAMASELREAIALEQLFVVYQPQVTLPSGLITGLEALVRWRHPERGVVGPGVFIPVAEEMGLIGKLGRWVLWTALRQAKAWREAGAAPVRMCVNLSARQFKSPLGLESDIAAAMAETAMPPELLELELTESVLMNASREHADVLRRLRERGVTLAIDDFGTGYSSLDYLRRFPADRIKIAQTFVRHLETSRGEAAIVKATIGLARELDIAVIAEGVETQAQLDLLGAWGCGEAQGFYFARPLTPDKVLPLLRDSGTPLPAAKGRPGGPGGTETASGDGA